MRITILGSGTGLPSLERNAPGYLLQTRDTTLLIDCGSGISRQLLRAGSSIELVDAILITHRHTDHIGELWAIIHALRHPQTSRIKPLTIFGPPGIEEFFNAYVAPVSGVPELFSCEVVEAAPRQEYYDLEILSAPTLHTPSFPSVAYRIHHADKSVVVTGDCELEPGIVDFCAGAELVVMDCSALAAGKLRGHLSAVECGELAAAAGVGRVVLSHLYPIPAPDGERVAECRARFAGPVELAADLAVVEW